MVIEALIIVAITFLTSFWAVGQLCKPSSRFYVSDIPNERSLHENPTPRNGGLGVLLALVAGYSVSLAFGFVSPEFLPIFGTAGLLAVTGYLDDRFNLKSHTRFAIHFAVAAATVLCLGPLNSLSLPLLEIPLGQLAIPFTMVFVVWMINLYNFMDGMDGFAGGMAVCGFATLAIFFQTKGATNDSILALIPAVAACGFLLFNFPPAKIFLGDAGSTVIGYLAAVFMITGQDAGCVPIWISVMIFSPFIMDATATLLWRLAKKERFWEAHRSHFYQRLVLSGLSHQRVLLFEYVLMLGCASLAIASLNAPRLSIWLFCSWILLLIISGWSVNFFIQKRVD